MKPLMIFRRVILPQGFKIAYASMTNTIIDSLKATSLAFAVGVVDIMGKGNQFASSELGVGQLGIFCAVALIYFILCFIVEKLLFIINRLLNKEFVTEKTPHLT